MSVLDDVLQASYAGVSFPVTRSSIVSGRKDVLKEFPGADTQLVEDLGKKPRSYTLDIVINPDPQGENYLQRRNRILSALEGGGKNKLIHPFDGAIEGVSARTLSLVEDFSNLGYGKLQAVFDISNTDGKPVVESVSITNISNSLSQTRQSSLNDFGNRYASPSTANNFDAAVDKVQGVINEFESNISFLSVSAATIDQFTAQISNLQDDIFQLVSEPVELGESITNLYTTVANLYSTPEAALEVLKKFFSFGEDDNAVEQTTISRREREKNRKTINAIMNINALTLSYQKAAEINFNTVDEVNAIADELEQQYQLILDNNLEDINSIFAEDVGASVETINLITDMRSTVQDFFDEQRITAKRIIEIRTVNIPSRVLAYQYYGDSSSGEDIAALNNNINVSFLEGVLDIFTA